MCNVKLCLDDLVGGISEKAELIQRDLVEPLALYYKHYQSTNGELLRQAQQFWNQLHQERTQMLFAKEAYHNHMFQMQQLQMQYSEAAQNVFGSERKKDDAHIGIQDKRLSQ